MTATQWLEVLTSYTLQVLIVIAICKLLEYWLPRSADRCALWNKCFVCLLILGCAALALPRLHLFQPWSRLEPQALLTVTATQSVVGRLILAVWLLGASVAAVRWATNVYYLRIALRCCQPLPDWKVAQLLGTQGGCRDKKEQPAILISDEADSPFCWQFHRPTIVLPRFLLEGTSDDLRFVMLHELEHLKTNHPLHLFLQQLAQIVCWFHPVVWRAGSWASLTREFSCDDAAANGSANSAAYLRTLLHIAERCELTRSSSAIGFGRAGSEIVVRARRLLVRATGKTGDNKSSQFRRGATTGGLCAATVLAGLLWIPSDPLSSSRSCWSPWPSWTAIGAQAFGWELRDYELYDRRTQIFEMLHENSNLTTQVTSIGTAIAE